MLTGAPDELKSAGFVEEGGTAEEPVEDGPGPPASISVRSFNDDSTVAITLTIQNNSDGAVQLICECGGPRWEPRIPASVFASSAFGRSAVVAVC